MSTSMSVFEQYPSLRELAWKMKLKHSERTRKDYLNYNIKFLEFIRKPPEYVTEDDIESYIRYRMENNSARGKPLAPATVHMIIASLHFFYTKIIGNNIVTVDRPKIGKRNPVVLTKKEIQDLLDSIENPKHKLMVELYYSSGLRLSELRMLKYSDLDLIEGYGWVRNGKGGKDRMFIICDTFRKHLLDYMAISGSDGTGYIFEVNGEIMSVHGIENAVKRAAERLGINKNVTVHTLRHSFATHLAEDGVDISAIKELLGHENLQTTMIYLHISGTVVKNTKSPLETLKNTTPHDQAAMPGQTDQNNFGSYYNHSQDLI